MKDLILELLLALPLTLLSMSPIKFLLGCNNLQLLFLFAVTQPHAAYSASNHGLISLWLFIVRTIPDIDYLFNPLEKCIQYTFNPAVSGHSPPGELEIDLFAFPTCIGGMGIFNPVKICASEFSACNKLTIPLQSLLLSRTDIFTSDIWSEQFSIKEDIYHLKLSTTSSHKTRPLDGAGPNLKRSIYLASKKVLLTG